MPHPDYKSYLIIATHEGFEINSVYEIFKDKYPAFVRHGCLNLQAAKDLIDHHLKQHRSPDLGQAAKKFFKSELDLYDPEEKQERFERGMNSYYEREQGMY